MQYFIDSVTGKVWGFEDNVVVTNTAGANSFATAAGVALTNIPTTLQSCAAPVPSTPTPAQVLQAAAAALIAGGITITSAGSPEALNGVYACDSTAQANMLGIVSYINHNNSFPGSSATTLTWYDINGQPHVFPSVAEFMALYTVGLDFIFDCQLIVDAGTGTLPPATGNIP